MDTDLDNRIPAFLQCSQEENTWPYFALVKLKEARKNVQEKTGIVRHGEQRIKSRLATNFTIQYVFQFSINTHSNFGNIKKEKAYPNLLPAFY